MIRLESISIRNFRGIRELDLEFAGKNYAIQGPNGSGKSGVVDAIEFALTGTISRLSGPGTGELSTKRHGPHVDYRDNPRESKVRLITILTTSGARATIERTLDRPKEPVITPDDPDIRKVFEQLSQHPEFVLSRRQIIKYILIEAGKRAEEIQSLLKLERIEELRSALQTASNNFTGDLRRAETDQKAARDALKRALSIEELSKPTILAEVNRLRGIAGVETIDDLTPNLRADKGVRDNGPGNRKAEQPASKKVALADLRTFRDLYLGETHAASKTTVELFTEKLAVLREDPSLVADLEKEQFLELGLRHFDGKACPLCATPWKEETLRELIRQKLLRLGRGKQLRQQMLSLGLQLSTRAQLLERSFTTLATTATATKNVTEAATLSSGVQSLRSLQEKLGSIVDILALDGIALTSLTALSPEQEVAVSSLQKTVEGLPQETGQGEARAVLVEAELRIAEVRKTDKRLEHARKLADKAKTVLATYNKTVETLLNRLYEDVEARFSAHYRLVNPDDESAFRAQIKHASGSVDLNVDFYGRGLFPPVAYHSEGHQDSMGLCLYLALMQQVLGEAFSFAVLDDVVMSVDATHRKEVCRLLKEQFADTQFIITTHDRIWLHQMRSAGLVTKKSAVLFNRWSVDHGPYVCEAKEAWEEIEEALQSDNVPMAAASLRRYLESLAHDIAERFAVAVPLKQDGAYDLGDLLPRIVSRWKELLGKAISAAQSWGDETAKTSLQQRKADFAAAAQQSNVEQWALNPAVHYNEWANFSRQDFEPVVGAFKSLLASFRCASCETWLYMESARPEATSIRCDCGKTVLNLKGRS